MKIKEKSMRNQYENPLRSLKSNESVYNGMKINENV